jgi:hypothetical protein
MLTYADVCWGMLAFACRWTRVRRHSSYAGVCSRIRAYGGVWVQVDEGGEAERLGLGLSRSTFKSSMHRRQSSFAADGAVNNDVCGRMLTYADVCAAGSPPSPLKKR